MGGKMPVRLIPSGFQCGGKLPALDLFPLYKVPQNQTKQPPYHPVNEVNPERTASALIGNQTRESFVTAETP